MATKAATKSNEGLQGLMDTLQKTEKSALDAMHRLADSVNDAFPDVGDEGDGPRKKIIDAAFKLTGDIVDSGHKMAVNVVDVTEDAVRGMGKKADAAAG